MAPGSPYRSKSPGFEFLQKAEDNKWSPPLEGDNLTSEISFSWAKQDIITREIESKSMAKPVSFRTDSILDSN
jgi:hypothetical protein